MDETIFFVFVTSLLPAVARITALVLTMPLMSSSFVGLRVKMALVVALSIAIIPGPIAKETMGVIDPLELTLIFINEALIGALMGLSCAVIFSGVQLAGGLIEGLCGLSLSSIGNAGDAETAGGPYVKLFWWTTAAVFVAAGGIGQIIDGLLYSFVVMPVGTAVFEQSFLNFLVRSVGYGFEFGISAVLPAIAGLLVASVVLGMAQRNFPQLGGLQVGLGIKAICGMAITSVVLLSAPWMIAGGVEFTLGEFQSWLEMMRAG